jgi:hypothetical protein
MDQNNEEKVLIEYDKGNDVLYISFGSPRPSVCVAEIDDVFIMKDIITKKYSGLTILDFSERLKDGSLHKLNLPFNFNFDKLETDFTQGTN